MKLTFGWGFSRDHYDEVYLEAAMIADIMNDAGYYISDEDAYKAWLVGADGVWEHPYDYNEADVVDSVLSFVSYWERQAEVVEQEPVVPPVLTDEEWEDLLERLEEEQDDYEPKHNARREGFAVEFVPRATIH